MDCENLLDRWAEQYPRELLAQWQAGNELIVKMPEVLNRMLDPGDSVTLREARAIAAALSELTDQDRDRLMQLHGEDPDAPGYADLKKSMFDPKRAAEDSEQEGQ